MDGAGIAPSISPRLATAAERVPRPFGLPFQGREKLDETAPPPRWKVLGSGKNLTAVARRLGELKAGPIALRGSEAKAC